MSRSPIFTKAAEDWQTMKQEHMRYIDYQYLAAIEACCGVLVNQLGKVDQIHGCELFCGPRSRAEKYASEELLEFWKQHPRLTLAEYEEQWITGRLEYQ